MSEALFDKATIEFALGAVAGRLAEQDAEPGVLIVVGGSFMALHDLREATRDVESITRIGAAVLFAARGEVDHDDVVRLWPRCGFASATEAVARYWDAYPHAPDDEYLVTYVEQVAAEAFM